MAKRIKHVSELPEWFQLKNYKDANTLDASSWQVQLVIRKYCLTHKRALELSEPLEVLRKKTFIRLSDHYLFKHWYDILSKVNIIDILTKYDKNPAISRVTLRTFFNIEKNLLPERKKYEPEFIDQLLDAVKSAAPGTVCIDLSEAFTKCSNAPKQDWLREPIYKSLPAHFDAEGLINVNLDFTDDVLIEQFKNWLSEIRTELNTSMKSKYFKQADFNSWALYGVLPYLDLKIWECEKDVSIPNRVMADAIFLSGVGGDETVRKTTAPLVEHLLSEKSLNQLAGQLSLEIAEHNQA